MTTRNTKKNTRNKTKRRPSLKEIENANKPRKLSKHNNNLDERRKTNNIVVHIVEKLLTQFAEFHDKVKYDDDVDDIKDLFEQFMCKDNVFNVKKTICGVGSYKVVLLCNENIPDCKYVYAFDFKHHPEEEGDEKFMKGGRYEDLHELDKYLSIAPLFHKKLYCGYSDRQRVDFMLLPNNGNELFNFLYSSSMSNKLKIGSANNLWLSLVFLLTTLYSFGRLHKKGYVHRDLKPENMLIGNPNNKARDFLTVTDYGFIIHKNEPRYDVTGTPEYLTPKISKVYQSMESSKKLTFIDLIEHDIHTIGYNLIQIMINNVFSGISSKAECKTIIRNCGKSAIKKHNIGKTSCKIDAMTYLACNDNIDGTLGERKTLMSIKMKHNSHSIPDFPKYILPLMKDMAIKLSAFGFTKHFKNVKEAQQYGLKEFKTFCQKLKKHEDFKIVDKTLNSDILKVKLNPLIWKQI